ncbi:MAG: radical SAM protein [Deltaproteobacteria bacterium]|jgi:oxygen-independent coproporphyrinogen-3 oxidase|nr:radical SAM protein [Deltaproteobacteria bacterium]
MDIPSEYKARIGGDPMRIAFDKPALGGAMQDRQMGAKKYEGPVPTFADLWKGAKAPLSCYINIPFCASFCPYCGFFKLKHTPQLEASYLEGLLSEIKIEALEAKKKGLKFQAVFVGGGTPTSFSANSLEKILGAIGELPLEDDAEITLEGRISLLSEEKIRRIWEGGVTRFSLGIQSFDEKTRQRAGRFDKPEKLKEILEALIETAPGIVTIDLIYGLPEQTLSVFEKDLATATELKVHGISLYLLKQMPTSPLFENKATGKRERPLTAAELSDYYRLSLNFLPQKGYRQLSVSHWSRDKRDRNLYNTFTMGRRDLVGVGAGAGGSINGASYLNFPSLEKYLLALSQKIKPILNYYPPSPLTPFLNSVSRQLLEGRVSLKTLDEAGALKDPLVLALLRQWEEASLLQENPDGFSLTQAGVFWRANMEFILRSLLTAALQENSL